MKPFYLSILRKAGKGEKTSVFILCLFFCLYGRVAWATTYVTVQPYEIKFNYEAGYINDALTIKDDEGGTATVPEWAYNGGSPQSENFAYIKSQSDRSIQVRFSSNCTDMHLIINLTVSSGTGIGTVCNHFEANYTAPDWITLELDGNIPGSVGARNFTWQWSVYALPLDITNYCAATSTNSTSHTYYTLLAAPQSPMSEPWTSVLDYACDWASGESTNSNVLYYLCYNLYNSSGLDYDGGQSHYECISYPSQKLQFNLTDFLQEWNKADCQDVSMFLSILSGSLGANLSQTRRIQGDFTTKSIDPVESTFGWRTVSWSFHHVGWLSNIFDPCVRLNSSSPYIPINSNIDSPYKIDLYYSGTWVPQSAFILGQTDPYWGLPTEIQ